MRGRNPSAAPGLEGGRGRAGYRRVLVRFEGYPSLSFHALNPRAKHDFAIQAPSASTKFGKSSNTQSFLSVLKMTPRNFFANAIIALPLPRLL